jgi:hypothetical protein
MRLLETAENRTHHFSVPLILTTGAIGLPRFCYPPSHSPHRHGKTQLVSRDAFCGLDLAFQAEDCAILQVDANLVVVMVVVAVKIVGYYGVVMMAVDSGGGSCD